MKIDKNLLIVGGVAAVGLYFLWPKIKENFSFNTVQAYGVRGNPAPDVLRGTPVPTNLYGQFRDPTLNRGVQFA